MVGKIFINYRRGDEAGFAQALFLRLEAEFAADDLFMDVEGHIKPGDDFVEVLNAQVAASDVLLVMIGPRWEELLAARQADPSDFVAIEIKAALDQRKRVIPVLVGGTSMPRADALPEVIRPLARRNAVGLRPERFKADCQGLVAALKESLAAAEQERAARTESERKAAEAARLEAEAQAAARARALEERGRAQAAAGLSADEIRKAEELANWDFVKDRNDLQDLRDHLARFPGGATERYALTKLDALAWSGLESAATAQQLRAYLDEFPKGENADAARGRIAALEREAAEAAAAELRRAQETDEWSRVAASTDIAAIKAFMAKWPHGQHAKAAFGRLSELTRAGSAESRGIWIGAATVVGLALLAVVANLLANQVALELRGLSIPLLGYAVFHGIVLTLLVWLTAMLYGMRSPNVLVTLAAGCIAAYMFESTFTYSLNNEAALGAGKSIVFAMAAAIAMTRFRTPTHWGTLAVIGLVAGGINTSFVFNTRIFVWETLLIGSFALLLTLSKMPSREPEQT